MNQKYNAHTDPLFTKLNILKYKHIFELCQLKFYHKYMNHELPLYVQDMNFDKYKHYFTRNIYELYKCRIKHDFARKSLRYNLPVTVNKTPIHIKSKLDTHSLQGFTWYFKKQTIDNYIDTCHLENCFVCENTNL